MSGKDGNMGDLSPISWSGMFVGIFTLVGWVIWCGRRQVYELLLISICLNISNGEDVMFSSVPFL